MSDLPDYTRLITVNVSVPPAQNFFYSKAESVTKYIAHSNHSDGAANIILVIPIGKKAGILNIFGATDGAGALFVMEARQSAALVELIGNHNVEANAQLNLRFTCWVPEQDSSDGINANLTFYLTGACGEKVSITVIYYLEDA